MEGALREENAALRARVSVVEERARIDAGAASDRETRAAEEAEALRATESALRATVAQLESERRAAKASFGEFDSWLPGQLSMQIVHGPQYGERGLHSPRAKSLELMDKGLSPRLSTPLSSSLGSAAWVQPFATTVRRPFSPRLFSPAASLKL